MRGYLDEHSSLLDEASLGIVKSLRTERGQPCRRLLHEQERRPSRAPSASSRRRLDRWLAPTNAKDAAAAEAALARAGGDKWRALAELAGK